jgi:TIR domain/Tetratricopeptide repeat
VESGWDFFISYTQADRAWAEWIAQTLEEDEHHILVQAWDSAPGANRVQDLRAGTRDAARTIVVLSCDYLTSVYGGAEWQAAWAGDPEETGRKLLTVRVADCDGPALLPAGRADLFGLSEGTAMARLCLMASEAIAGQARPQASPASPAFPGPRRATPRAARFPGQLPRLPGLDRDTAEAIAEELGRLPLALEQAASWLNRSRMPGLEYLELLRRHHAGSGARTGDHGGAIAALWDIGADRITAESPAAVQLLGVCAYLAPEPVPLDLFTAHAELLPEPLSSAAADPLAFAATIAVLTGYALASRTPAGLEPHRLVQAAVRARSAGAVPDPLALALWLLRVDAPAEIYGSSRSWPRWAALLPHVLAATGHPDRPLAPTALEDTAWLLDRAATYLQARDRLADAKALHERALILDEAIYGPDHPAVAMRLDILARILRDLGQLE